MVDRKYFFYIIGVALIWGFTAIIVRYLPLHPLQTMCIASFIALLILGVWYLATKKLSELKVSVPLSLFLGLLFMLNNSFFFMAIKKTTVANAVFAHYTSPIFAAILAPFILKEKLEKKTLLALAISMLGLFLLGYKDMQISGTHLSGLLFGIASGFFFGWSIIIIKQLMDKTTPSALLFYQSLVPALLLLPSLFLLPFSISGGQVSLLVFYSLVMYLLGSIFFVIACKRVLAQHVGIFAYFEPLSSVCYAALFFGEVPGITALFGGLLIIGSGILILKKTNESKARFSPKPI